MIPELLKKKKKKVELKRVHVEKHHKGSVTLVCSSVPSENCTWDARSLKQSLTQKHRLITNVRSAKTFSHSLNLCKKKKKQKMKPRSRLLYEKSWHLIGLTQWLVCRNRRRQLFFFLFFPQIDVKRTQTWSCCALRNRRPPCMGRTGGSLIVGNYG